MSRTGDQRRLLEMFDRLLDVPADAREAWIREHAGDDPELREGLVALLEGHEVDAGPLDRSPVPAGDADTTEDAARLVELLARELGDRYEILDELGRGGMAIVFRAHERKHDRTVVLKALRPELRPYFGEDRFEREVRIASKMSHPNIVGLIDSGTAAGLPYFVMPFVEGETLRMRLDREGAPPPETARTLLHDVAAGLEYAHRQGIVHRDLKPDNILLSGDHAYILDFGIARPYVDVIEDDDLTRPGLAIGTPRYMAPEQREGRPVDRRADLYAWGLIARELTAGAEPPEWAGVVDRCLQPEPSDRPDDAKELLRALEADGAWGRGFADLAGRAWPWATAALALALLAWGFASRSKAPEVARAPEGSGLVAGADAVSLPFAVSPFRNETGREEHDMLGRLAADWIIQGLQQAEAGPVIPWSASREAARDLVERGETAADAGEFGEQVSAGTVISGAIYALGDRLSFAASITDVRNQRVVSAPAPISVPPDSAEFAIRELRDRILGSLAIERDPLFAKIPGMSGKPPVLEAYRTYERGLELFESQEYGQAQAEYDRAFELDTTFLAPKLGAAVAAFNQGHWEDVDSILAFLELRRERLTEYHDLRRRALVAQREGDGERAYRLEKRRAELGPTPMGSYNAAHLANDLNRPDDALRLLLAQDPNSPGLRGWAQYWTQLAHAYHSLGRYEDEFAAAQEMWARFPERRVATVLAARALAAAGRQQALDSLLSALVLLPEDTYWSMGAALVVAGEETRAHRGDGREARRLLREGVDWLEARLAEHPNDRSHRYWLASARYDLEQFEAAHRLFAELWREYPERTDFRAGALVARTHLEGPDFAREELSSEDLSHGWQHAGLARVEAAGGDGERAMSLLTEGLRRGISGRPWLHATSLPDLGRLADDSRYVQALGEVLPPVPYPD